MQQVEEISADYRDKWDEKSSAEPELEILQ